ncbi:hypothetical protein DXG01_016093 [Tephrocybe rancida]|nr:hypothetical protein DXG01_016093 [Tephrocybe rancida]
MQPHFTAESKASPHKAPMTGQAQGKQNAVSRPTVRILGDKTPFPNRSKTQKFETPAPQISKFPALSFLETQPQLPHAKTPDSQLRPSSARKQDRAPRSVGKVFQTPLNNGNHWDVSELSIVVPDAEALQDAPEDDYDEIEYMPPNTLHLASEPAFNLGLPDYKEVGKALYNFSRTCPYDDTPVPEIEINEKDVRLPGWDMLSVKELESDDPFRQGVVSKMTASRKSPGTTLLARPKPTSNKSTLALPKLAPITQPPISTRLKPTTSEPKTTATRSTQPALQRPSVKSGAVPSSAKPPITLRSAKPAVKPSQTVPSRSATATATLNRPASTLAPTLARRPATSTSQYKTLPSSRSGLSKVAPTSTKKDDGMKLMDIIPLAGEAGMELDDDFRFDV